MDIRDLIDLFVSERTTACLHCHIDASRKEYDINDQWLELLSEKAQIGRASCRERVS